MAYYPLHVITGYTFLNSALKISPYVNKGKELGFFKLGICDFNPYSFPHLYKEVASKGIKPIFGMSITFLYEDKYRTICLYIENEKGYKNLCSICSKIKDDVYEGDFSSTDGLIAIVPLLSSSFFNINEPLENSLDMLLKLKKKFTHFYLGSECYKKEQVEFLNNFYEFANENNFLTIAFPKTLCLKKEDGLTLEIIRAIKEDKKLNTYEEITTPYYLLSENEAREIYRKEDFLFFEENKFTDFNFLKKRGELLSFPLSSNKKEYIYNKSVEFLKRKNLFDEKHLSRLNYELDVIEKMGYLDYFLIVSDYVKYAKSQNILVGPGRGSACGSLISYTLEITCLDPLKYDLLFERFLNPHRVSMPDIDIDFLDYRRDEIIKYISDKYGKDKVRNIITFQTIRPKQAIRDIGRVFSFNPSDINLLCNSIKDYQDFKEVYNNSIEFKNLLKDEHFKKIASLAKKIEGLPRQKGLHAAGIIINNTPLKDNLPIMGDDEYPVPFEAPYLESLGFLKMDLLGLRNLSIIELALKKWHKENLDYDDIPLDDKETLDLLKNGYTKGIFQLESEGFRKSVMEVGVDSFNDIIALNALYRPGPMKFITNYAKRKKGLEPITYVDDRLKPILKDTYGIIVYQEQVMNIAQVIASFSLAKADILRRAISKKDNKVLLNLEKEFISGAINNGLKKEDAQKIYDYIFSFGDYGFNKSHSASYSLISYMMAYLKAHASKEFFASLLDMQKSSPSYSLYSSELHHFKIDLLPPDINKSEDSFSCEKDGIRLPLSAIHNFPPMSEKEIIEERKKGKFTSLSDFFLRMSYKHITEQTYLLLINSGAFDSFSLNRATLRKALNIYMLYASNMKGIEDLSEEERKFMEPKIIPLKEDLKLKGQLEFASLGILLSCSLFEPYQNYFQNIKVQRIKDIKDDNSYITFPCFISNVRIIETKNKEEMEIISCYDESDKIKIVVFPRLYKTLPFLQEGDALLVTGRLNKDTKGTSFIAHEIIKMEVKDE